MRSWTYSHSCTRRTSAREASRPTCLKVSSLSMKPFSACRSAPCSPQSTSTRAGHSRLCTPAQFVEFAQSGGFAAWLDCGREEYAPGPSCAS
eukprot:3627878-Rhodomonas_salina.1